MGTMEATLAAEDKNKKSYVIFVGDIKEEWPTDTVQASDIMKKAGVSDPSKFVLEALDHRGGKPVAEFTTEQFVHDLGDEDKQRKFFRVTPGGGGRS